MNKFILQSKNHDYNFESSTFVIFFFKLYLLEGHWQGKGKYPISPAKFPIYKNV